MTSAKLSQLIEYYKQCYQASFQTGEGHGVFENKDIKVLGVYNGTDQSGGDPSPFANNTIRELFAQWLVDQENTYLVRFKGLMLSPNPNASGTTDVHYKPVVVEDYFSAVNRFHLSLISPASINAKIGLNVDGQLAYEDDSDRLTNTDAEANTESNVKIDLFLESIIEGAPNLDSMFQLVGDSTLTLATDAILPGNKLPSLNNLNQWLIKQANKVATETLISLDVVALIPRNLKSTEFKQEFIHAIDNITNQSARYSNEVLGRLLMADKPKTKRTSVEIDALPFLSKKQQKSIANALAYDISFIQGPPGTGKTYTIAALVATLMGINKSVLIATHSDHALSVIKDKLVDEFYIEEQMIVHFGHGRRDGTFARQIKKLSRALIPGSQSDLQCNATALVNDQLVISKLTTKIQTTIDKIPLVTHRMFSDEIRFFDKLKELIWGFKYKQPFVIAEQVENLSQSIKQYPKTLGLLASSTLRDNFKKHYAIDAQSWGQLSLALSKKSVAQAVEGIQADQKIFQPQSGLKLWLSSLDDVPSCTAGEFDYVIIDEATQVNMATAIPALSKASKLVVVGDPKQLRHVSFLSGDQEQRIASRLNLEIDEVVGFRNTSLLDYVDDYLVSTGQSDAVTLLDEHYRSIPPLMQFNSDQFYNGEVQVLTGFHRDSQQEQLHLSWQRVDGKRQEKINSIEAQALLVYLIKLIESSRQSNNKLSIGVLSFFRDQADYLKQQILQNIDLRDIKNHQIKIGTPFSFQGEERDHILISCTIDDDTHHGTWTYLNRADVFNVATSRARHKQTMFLSATPEKLPINSILKQYYSFSLPMPKQVLVPSQEPWLLNIINVFRDNGFTVGHQHRIADIEIDIVLSFQGQRLAIDLIGFPGDLGVAVHLSRYITLSRVGIPLLPLTATDWLLHQDDCLQKIQYWAQNKPSRLLKKGKSVQSKESNLILQKAAEMHLVEQTLWIKLQSYSDAPELSTLWGFDLAQQVMKLEQMDKLLLKLFEPGTITYLRYQSAVNTAVKKSLDNFSTYQLLHGQVWDNSSAEPAYWESLVEPIKVRDSQINEALNTLHVSLQRKIAQGQTQDEFALADLENLAKRLEDYN